MAQARGADVVAIVGAVTGGLALVWNVLRSVSERPRLHLNFFVFEDRTPDHQGPSAAIEIVNVGRLPAYIAQLSLVERLPRADRLPLASIHR